MNHLEKLISMGAYSCAGDLMLDGKVVARLRNGAVDLTDEGRELVHSNVEDTDVKPERSRRTRSSKQDSTPDKDGFLSDVLG